MNSERIYRRKSRYRDTSSLAAGDQFMGWINIPGSGMQNVPGIRPLKYVLPNRGEPAYLVLVTNHLKGSGFNRWDDDIDLDSGRILYWGDAKHGLGRDYSSFQGNQRLAQVWELVKEKSWSRVPPILHFSKREEGYVTFNGLCVMRNLTVRHFLDHGHRVQNYLADLEILPEPEVQVDWLHGRAREGADGNTPGSAPECWTRFESAGFVDFGETREP